jgi:DNA repair protein RadA/Sms
MINKSDVVWICSECGHNQSKWSGSCVKCNTWNSFAKDVVFIEKKKRFLTEKVKSKPIKISDIKTDAFFRIKTNITEFDRLLGGGLVSGSLLLVGGAPGIGKSTLMLQISNALAKNDLKVLYICAEESPQQTSLRAKRINVNCENLYLLSETDFGVIKAHIDNLKPDILIVDSIQILYKADIPSSPGSVVQVRELATEFMHIAKGHGITTFLIGHVTKSGEIAGPRVLEHIVDTVLDFEGEKQNGFRLLRSVKNRFGPTDDIAIFQMKEDGLESVKNPSSAFLEERQMRVDGSAIVPTIEGVRSMLIEVQSLVSHSVFATPSRKSTGLDQNRLSLLLAVLEKRLKYQLHGCDVFVSVAGGMKIKEPGIDLGIILSIASSFSNRKIPTNIVVVGEVGLNGEVRRVQKIESRIKEAINMGFDTCIIPKQNFQDVEKLKEKIKIFPVEIVDQAIEIIL